MAQNRTFVSLGMFIIDQFEYLDENGNDIGRPLKHEIGGGGTYAAIGARIWLPPEQVGMIVDRGPDFPVSMQQALDNYGHNMWLFRERKDGSSTTAALNSYRGEHRGFQYLTPRIRITPQDLKNTPLDKPKSLHFICSPARASVIMAEVKEVEDWNPISIFEPIPDRCIPEELEALIAILPQISILSPNAEEASSLLSFPLPPTTESIERAAHKFLKLGVKDAVIIRSAGLGAYVLTREGKGEWIPAYWGQGDKDKIIDVTGAGNAFLGGLGAGLHLTNGDIYTASLYATVSASFTIEQSGLPVFSHSSNLWNQDSPDRRLEALKDRCSRK